MCNQVCVPYPNVWYSVACNCHWGCSYGCRCHRCHFQPSPAFTFTPAVVPQPVERKIDRILELAEIAEKERKRAALVNKKRSGRW